MDKDQAAREPSSYDASGLGKPAEGVTVETSSSDINATTQAYIPSKSNRLDDPRGRPKGDGQVINPKEGLNPFTSSLLVVNYISVSYLLLPGGFSAGGTLLTTFIFAVVSLQAYLTAKFVLEACARAEALEHIDSVDGFDVSVHGSMYERSSQSRRDLHVLADSFRGVTACVEGSRHNAVSIPPEHTQEPSETHVSAEREPTRASETYCRKYSMEVRFRKFELSLLNKMFLGKTMMYFFAVTTILDLYGITWTFCSIFASALADKAPISTFDYDYELYVGIFVIVAVPLSCTSIVDQIYIQMAFLGARLFMVLMMVGTLIGAYVRPSESHFGTQVGPAHNVPLADWSEGIQAIQTAVFATAFQFSVPSIGSVSRDKQMLTRIFKGAAGFIFLSNIVLGLMASIYFGRDIDPSSNLNWVDYHGGTFDVDSGTRSMWSTAISYYIVLFAAIDGVAIYPLIALSLGDIMMGAIYGERVHEAEKNWKIRAGFRLLASFPQAVGALFVLDLGVIALYAGIFTIVSYTVCPAMLCIASRRRMDAEALPIKTFYSSTFPCSYHVCAYLLLVASAFVIAGVVVESVVRYS